jgi:hypothetical protein
MYMYVFFVGIMVAYLHKPLSSLKFLSYSSLAEKNLSKK